MGLFLSEPNILSHRFHFVLNFPFVLPYLGFFFRSKGSVWLNLGPSNSVPFRIKLQAGEKKTTCLFLLLVLPAAAAADLKNPEIVTLRNFTRDNIGVYRCTASNDVGEEHCTVEVSMQRESEEVWWGSASSSPRSCDLAAPAAKSTLHPSPDPPTDHLLPDLSGFFFFFLQCP